MKDNFSKQSDLYAQYRPSYPEEIFRFIYSFVGEYKCAMDCASGNGQVAAELAAKFNRVIGTDISRNQLSLAHRSANIHYIVEKAEQSSLRDNTISLLTVAQAIHWFDFKSFYNETLRILKPGGVIAVIGYHLLRIDNDIDRIIDDFYSGELAPYWDEERKYIDEYYRTIPFPFEEIPSPLFQSEFFWDLDHLIGYLNSWSAVQHFKDKNHFNPLNTVLKDLQNAWGNTPQKKVVFPIFLKLGTCKAM